MPVFVAVFLYMLLQVDDVSAQTSCVISPNLTNLVIFNTAIQDVELHCQCMDSNGTMITGTRWFNGNTIISQSDTNHPYSTNTVPSRLIFDGPFTSSYDGTYTCSPGSTFPTISTGDAITLSARMIQRTDRICTIHTTSVITLTDSGARGEIVYGTENVTLFCVCLEVTSNVAVRLALWSFNGTQITNEDDRSDTPYVRDRVFSILTIPTFTAADVGTYGCTTNVRVRQNDTIFLTLPGLSNVRATVLTPRSVEVTWDEYSIPSTTVTGYLISYTTTASYTNGGTVMANNSNTTSHTLTNLEENTPYTISVQAVIADNKMSGNTLLSVTTYTDVPDLPPRNVMVTGVDPASLTLSWQPSPIIYHNGMITGHVIQYTRVGSSDMISVNVTSGTTYTISGLVAYVDYSVILATVNVNGTGPFSDLPMIVRSGEDVPSQPNLLDIVSVNSSSVTLQWSTPDMPNGIITQYSLQYNSTPTITISVSSILIYTVGGLSSENVYVFQVSAHTRVGAGPPRRITVVTSPAPVSDVVIPIESVTSSTLNLTWMEISLTNSILMHYTVFYLPLRDAYGPIITSNRRKRQSAQDGQLTINFPGTNATLIDLYGAVTYRIQVVAVVTLNGQEVAGDRSVANEVTTLEGVPTAPCDLNVMVLNNNDVMVTWRRPDPPNGLITQYSVSYVNTNSQGSNNTILQVDNGGDSKLSHTWANLIQGTYNFSVVASTRTGQGRAATTLFAVPSTCCDGNTDDKSGAVITLAILLAIAVIGSVICVVINIYLVVKLRRSRYSTSDVKQSRDNNFTDSTSNYIEQSEPEYEDIDSESNMKTDSVTIDANPAYQVSIHS